MTSNVCAANQSMVGSEAGTPSRPSKIYSRFPVIPSRERRHPLAIRYLPVILAMAAGGLMVSAMIGASLFAAPTSALSITCIALLGVYLAFLTLREASAGR